MTANEAMEWFIFEFAERFEYDAEGCCDRNTTIEAIIILRKATRLYDKNHHPLITLKSRRINDHRGKAKTRRRSYRCNKKDH